MEMTWNRWSRSGAVPLLLAMGCVVGLLGGCSSREDVVVAEVGDRRITIGEVEATWARLDSTTRPDIGTDEGRRALVQDLIKKHLLEAEAHAVLGEADAGMQRRLHRFTESSLLEALQKREVMDRVRVSEEDIRKMFERRQQILTARHILVPTREEADEVLRLLSVGATFEALAQQRSRDSESGANGGLLNPFMAGDVVAPFEEAVYALKPGQTSAPVQSQFGWHVIRLEKSEPRTSGTLEQERPIIENTLRNRQGLDLAREFRDGVLNEMEPKYDDDTLMLVNRKFIYTPSDPNQDITMDQLSSVRSMPVFAKEESTLALVKMKGGRAYTVGDYLNDLAWVAPGVWPNGMSLDDTRKSITDQLRIRLQLERARSLGLDKRPDFVERIERRRNEMYVNTYYYTRLVPGVQATEEQARSFYARHPERYSLPERIRLATFGLANENVAKELAEEWRGGSLYSILTEKYSPKDPNLRSTPDTDYLQPGSIDASLAAVFSLGEGEVGGPYFSDGRWVVVRVVEKRPPEVLPFDSPEVKQGATSDATTELQETILNTKLEELDKKYGVKLHEENFAKIQRPAAGERRA